MSDVIVIGGGIIGLAAAARLRERGAHVTVWSADEPGTTVSSVAAAVWYPSRAGADPRVLQWATATYAEFRRQADAGVPGVLLRRTRNLLRSPIAGPPWWAPAAGQVEVVDGAGPYAQEVRFLAPLAEMTAYLGWLRERLVADGVRIELRRVARLSEATAPVVVNATGLGAAELCPDAAVRPARGQVVLVDNPGLDVSIRDEENPDGLTYIHPRRDDVVLGGTFEVGRADLAPDSAETAAIVRRCTALVPELAGAKIRAEKTGLRPMRAGGPRLAAEQLPDGRRIVHSYGHGGAGMTLAWGCADEVADLALKPQ